MAGQASIALDPRRAGATTTQAIFRALLLKGLAPEEASNLTAFICGISAASGPWQLDQINSLLFLRQLYRSGCLTGDDRGEVPPD